MQSLQLAHRLENKNVLLIGAGEVAVTRMPKLLPTGCRLTIVSPSFHRKIRESFPPGIPNESDSMVVNDEWTSASRETYRLVKDTYKPEHLYLESHWHIVLVCISDHDVSREIYAQVQKQFGPQQLINVADVPPLCNFYFGANCTLAHDRLQVLVSSNGLSPRFAALVRDEIAAVLSAKEQQLEEAIARLGDLRARIRSIACNRDDVAFRMSWIKIVTDTFGLERCNLLDVDKLAHLFAQMYAEWSDGTAPPAAVTATDFPAPDQLVAEYSLQ